MSAAVVLGNIAVKLRRKNYVNNIILKMRKRKTISETTKPSWTRKEELMKLFVSSLLFSIAFSYYENISSRNPHFNSFRKYNNTNKLYLLLYKKVAGIILFNLAVPMPDMCGKVIAE